MKRFLLAALLSLLAFPALAADCWVNSGGTQANCGAVQMYLNGSSQSVAVSSTAPLPTSAATVGYTSGKVAITRPANTTAYTANDVVGGAITFPTMGPSGGGEVRIISAQLELDIAAIPAGMTSFNLYLYNVTPPSAIADNGAFDIPAGDRASFLGKFSLGTPVDEGSTLYIETNNIQKQITVPSGSTVFGYLVTAGGFTPAANSEVYAITLHAVGM